MKVGDSVWCYYDLVHHHGTVKKGYTLIVKKIIDNRVVLERFGKLFIVGLEDIVKK